MSRRGDCWDNAPAESLIKTIKAELGRSFLTRELAQRELFEYIEGFYNTRRLHSGLGYRTPLEAEHQASAHVLTHTGGALPLPASAIRHVTSGQPTKRHTWGNPGPQSQGSSLPCRSGGCKNHKDPKIAGLPKGKREAPYASGLGRGQR
jgi:hypothetical protein